MIQKTIDLTRDQAAPVTPLPTFGGSNGQETLGVNSRCFTRDGRPVFPIMGEFHFSRYPAAYWEESLQKMRAGGIEIVASYVIWIHHEEEQNVYDWTGSKDLRRFVQLCGRTGLRVWLRIGPWSHAEVRNGGFPDWLAHAGIPLRENNRAYLDHVRRFWSEIVRQVDGLFFKDGGPVVGVQIENEYGHCGGLSGEAGVGHMKTLKRMAVELGFVTPFYTSTGWGNGVVVEDETLPVLGGYAEAPWDQHTRERAAAREYLFDTVRRETDIGADLAGNAMFGSYSYHIEHYPYLTAELGGGLQPTHHRRPIAAADDIGALAHAFLGSGANLLGYYMYHGGTNPNGRFSTLQESRATGSPNDLPELSYDFQAPIGEYGNLRASYGRLKAYHLFLRDFAEEMASSVCRLPPDAVQDAEDTGHLRYSVRYGEKGGFLFLSNYQRRRRLEDHADVNIRIDTEKGRYGFEHLSLPNGKYVFYPFEMDLGGVTLLSATAQPLCKIQNGGHTTFVFFADEDTPAVYRFRAGAVQAPFLASDGDARVLRIASADWRRAFELTGPDGRRFSILTIGRKDACRAWKIRRQGQEHLLLTDAAVRQQGDALLFSGDSADLSFLAYPALRRAASAEEGTGDFTQGALHAAAPARLPSVSVRSSETLPDGSVDYTLDIRRSQGGDVDDDFLHIQFDGDRAELFLDGVPRADWFYLGTGWTVGLKRFGDLDGCTVRLRVYPLHETDAVFLEKRPAFVNGAACALRAIRITPEFVCHME